MLLQDTYDMCGHNTCMKDKYLSSSFDMSNRPKCCNYLYMASLFKFKGLKHFEWSR